MKEEEAALTSIAELVVRLMSDAEADLTLRQATFPNFPLCSAVVSQENQFADPSGNSPTR